MKKIFIQGIIAGILSAIEGIIYFNIYQMTFETHFDKVVNMGSIAGASIFGSMLIATSYALLFKFNKQNFVGWLNVVIVIVSFASIISPISISLPLDIENPELFPGLIVPMHFFPALTYFTIVPFYQPKNKLL